MYIFLGNSENDDTWMWKEREVTSEIKASGTFRCVETIELICFSSSFEALLRKIIVKLERIGVARQTVEDVREIRRDVIS